MSMIFEEFPSMEQAEAFVAAVKDRYGLDGQTFATAAESDEDDWHPWVSVPPIAHIDRVDDVDARGRRLSIDEMVAAEERVEAFAGEFGGRCTGT